MTDFFHTLKDKATGKLYSVLDVNAAKKDLSNIGMVNVSIFTNDAGYLTAIPNTYKTKTENDGLYQAKGSYLTAIPSAYKTKTENDALYQAKGNYLTAIPSTYKTKTENDALYQAKGSYLTAIPSTYKTKTENDALYQAKGNYLTAIPNTVALKTDISSFKAPGNTSIGELSNVDISSGLVSGKILEFDGNNFIPVDKPSGGVSGSSTLDGLTDTNTSSATTNDILRYKNNKWTSEALDLTIYALKANYYTKSESYTASEIDTKISGYEIKGTAYSKGESDGKYALKTAITGLKTPNNTSIGELSDVTVSSAKNGQVLVYDNGQWKNNEVAGGSNIVTYNAEWTPDLSKPIPNVIKDLKKGAWIRFNNNILELKDDGDKLTKSPDLDSSNYKMVIPNRSVWDKGYQKYIKDELVFHNNAWWKCKQIINVGDEPGTNLGDFKWEKYEGTTKHEDYLRLDGGKLWSGSGHQVAENKNIVTYKSPGKLQQADGTEIGIISSSDLNTALSQYATNTSLTNGLAGKLDKPASGQYNVTVDGSFDLLGNGQTLTGSNVGQIPRTDVNLAIKAKRAIFDNKDNVVRNGNNYVFQTIDANGAITDEQVTSKDSIPSFVDGTLDELYAPDGTKLDFTTNAKVDAKIASASSKVAITYDETNEEITVDFS